MTARPPKKPRRSGDLAIVPAAAVFDLRLSNADIRVFAALSAYADKEGRCWPATPTLADRTGMSERHIRTSLRNLETFDYVETKKRPGQSNIYRIPRNHTAGVPRKQAAGVEPDPGTILPEPRNHTAGDPGSGLPPNGNKNDTKNDYAFLGKVIRLGEEGFDRWAEAYCHLDLRAELQALDDWYDSNLTDTERKKWFQRCSAALAKKNRTARLESNAGYGDDSDVIH